MYKETWVVLLGSIVILVASIAGVLLFVSNEKYDIINIDFKPYSSHIVNQTEMTSLVTSTQQQNNLTIIHLSNNAIIQTNDTSIKSGDSIALKAIILKPDCSLSISSNAGNITNGTIMKVYSYSDPLCDESSRVLKLTDWYKLNQK